MEIDIAMTTVVGGGSGRQRSCPLRAASDDAGFLKVGLGESQSLVCLDMAADVFRAFRCPDRRPPGLWLRA